MIVDVKRLAEEYGHFSSRMLGFVAPKSVTDFNNTIQELNASVTRGADSFEWSTKRREISLRSTKDYDRPGKSSKQVTPSISFVCKFEKLEIPGKAPKRKKYWRILKKCVCELNIYVSEDEDNGQASVRLHADLKNPNQWGPLLHMQINEHDCDGIAVPRTPHAFVLPQDCLDFWLGELYHEEWRRLGISSQGHAIMRAAQTRRLEALGKATWEFMRGKRTGPALAIADLELDPEFLYSVSE